MSTQTNGVSLDQTSDHVLPNPIRMPSSLSLTISQTELAAMAAGQAMPRPEAAPAMQAADVGDVMQRLKIDHEEERIRSFLAEGEVVEGNLRLKNGIRIAGTVTGRVDCENGTVVVEKTGVVTGGISTPSRIIVDGVVGDPEKSECTDKDSPSIRTPGLLAVLNNGKVFGCYQYGRIATYDDATLEGMGKKIKS